MRLFVALELADAARRAAAQVAAEWQAASPAGRWVRSENQHVTLAFLGEQKTRLLDPLRAALKKVASEFGRFEVAVEGAGYFPPRGPARVLWLGLKPQEPLVALQAAVSRALIGIGPALSWQPETRPWSPHLTLARFDPPLARDDAADMLERFAPIPSPVERITLFESKLGTGGARYQALGVFPLAEESA